MTKPTILLLAIIPALLTGCASSDATTTARSPDGTVIVTESLDAMKERLFHSQCDKVLDRRWQ